MLLLAWNNKYSIHILNYLKSLKGAPPAIKDQTGESSKSEAQTWGQLYRRLAKIAPFLWPNTSVWLQFLAVSDGFIKFIYIESGCEWFLMRVNELVPVHSSFASLFYS